MQPRSARGDSKAWVVPQARCAVPKGFEIDPTLNLEEVRSLVIYKGLWMCLEPRSAQEYFEAIVARSAVSGAKGIKIFLTLRNFSSDNCIAACHTPPSPLFQHQWAAPHQCQNKFCRWLRLAPLVYLRGGVAETTIFWYSFTRNSHDCAVFIFQRTPILFLWAFWLKCEKIFWKFQCFLIILGQNTWHLLQMCGKK